MSLEPATLWRCIIATTGPSQRVCYIDREGELEGALASHLSEAFYAIDTEFISGKFYDTRLALVQLGWPDEILLIDPLKVDLAPLTVLFEGTGTALLHAAASDLEIMEDAIGLRPSAIFDTQLAAQILGWPTPSLKVLAGSVLGITLDKTKQYSDWLERPLPEASLTYAASDVAYLHAIESFLSGKLADAGRSAWAKEEFDAMLERSSSPLDSEELWWRISRVGALKADRQLIVQRLAMYRDEQARARNRPSSHILRDEAIVAIATRPPNSPRALKSIKGLSSLPDNAAREIVEVIHAALAADPHELRALPENPFNLELEPVLNVLAALARQRAMDLEIDTDLLARRRDLTAYLSGSPNRLTQGWRRDCILEDVELLRSGKAQITLADDRVRLLSAE
ncbi:MAG: HRDC domain-containing protein [Actinomycetes bacterium]